MSGSIGAVDIAGGDTSDSATAVSLEAVQTPSTHVGTAGGPLGFFWNGCVLQFQTGIPFIATPDLYAALNASPTAAALITWSD